VTITISPTSLQGRKKGKKKRVNFLRRGKGERKDRCLNGSYYYLVTDGRGEKRSSPAASFMQRKKKGGDPAIAEGRKRRVKKTTRVAKRR